MQFLEQLGYYALQIIAAVTPIVITLVVAYVQLVTTKVKARQAALEAEASRSGSTPEDDQKVIEHAVQSLRSASNMSATKATQLATEELNQIAKRREMLGVAIPPKKSSIPGDL